MTKYSRGSAFNPWGGSKRQGKARPFSLMSKRRNKKFKALSGGRKGRSSFSLSKSRT